MKVKFFTTPSDKGLVLINPMQIVSVKSAGANTEIWMTNGEKFFSTESLAQIWNHLLDYPEE